MRLERLLSLFVGMLLFAACSSAAPVDTPGPALPTATTGLSTENAPATLPADQPVEGISTQTPVFTETPEPGPVSTKAAPTKTSLARPIAWQDMPVIPEIGYAPEQIYRRGLELGNRPQVFSKIGDCGSTPSWFLGDFDRGPKYYQLGLYTDLQPVIDYYQGSFSRTSLAAKSGFNASSVFAPLWADRSQCEVNESPLACEYRVNRPSLALIMLGTNDVWHIDSFEPQMRKMIELSIEKGIVPILSTKADNVEGDGSINAIIAHLAVEYDVPLWNYWRAVQDLPDAGLQEDGAHITWGPNRFDDPWAMTRGWTVRNLTALQVLDAVWRSLSIEG